MAEMSGNIGTVTVSVEVDMVASEQFDKIVNMLGYVKENDADILTLALDFISEREGSCPFDMFDFKPFGGCEVECGKRKISTCWYEYFKSKVVG